MIALDTNVLVRFLVRDYPEQFSRAKQFIEQKLQEGESFFLSDIVHIEKSSFHFS